jgi:hypothetical protein
MLETKPTSPKPTQKWAEVEVVTGLQVWHPAVRMVVLHVWDDDGKPGQDVYPVLAISTTARRTYARSYFTAEPDPPGTSERTLLRNGWSFDALSSGVRHDLLVYLDGDIMPLREAQRHYLSGVVEMVVCSWPPEEDERQLADVARRMRDRLAERRRTKATRA